MKALSLGQWVTAGLVITLSACGGDDAPPLPSPAPCVDDIDTSCSLLFSPPVYSTLYTEVIVKSCALSASCHAVGSRSSYVTFGDADATYRTLLGLDGGPKHVIPGDPQCSPMTARLESDDPNFVMPQGMKMSAPARCNFVQWIAEGAQKN